MTSIRRLACCPFNQKAPTRLEPPPSLRELPRSAIMTLTTPPTSSPQQKIFAVFMPPPPHTHTPPCLQAIYLTAATASYTQLRELLQHHLPRLAGEGWGQVWGRGRRTICCSCTPPPGEGGREGPVQERGHSAAVIAHHPRSPSDKSQINENPDFAATPQLRRPPQTGHSPGNKDSSKTALR